MNVNELFKRKQPARRVKPGGLTKAQENQIQADFAALIEPIGEKATIYFRKFVVNQKEREWLLPTESWQDVPVEKMQYVLKYGAYFVAEIKKVELDDVPYSWL